MRIADPFDQSTFFIQRRNCVCPDICLSMACHSRIRSHSCLRLDSEALFNNLFIIVLKSISRASFRRSSCGLHKNGYLLPSLPRRTSFFGRCKEGITSIRSSIPGSQQCQPFRITFYFYRPQWKGVMRLDRVGTRRKQAIEGILQWDYHSRRQAASHIGKIILDR